MSKVRWLYQNVILNRRVSRPNDIKSYFETQVNMLFVLLLAHFLKAVLVKTTLIQLSVFCQRCLPQFFISF